MDRKRYSVIIVVTIAALLFLAVSCTEPTNHPPSIASLEVETDWTVPSGSLQVTCIASDPDGDQLGYIWSASSGQVSGAGATINWTAPPSEGSYDITVTVMDGRGGQVTDRVTITVRANKPPAITSLVASANSTLPLGTIQVTCNASDPEGDKLTYQWSASGGTISGTGPVVNWTAPQQVGIYRINVIVTDTRGGTFGHSLPISVVAGQPPTIESLLVTADHCYLKLSASGYQVGQGQEYRIQCIVSGTSGPVSYQWSCTGGNISGAGSSITWTAPNHSVDITVTVTVTDVVGKSVSKGVLLEVVPCSPCIFRC